MFQNIYELQQYLITKRLKNYNISPVGWTGNMSSQATLYGSKIFKIAETQTLTAINIKGFTL